MLTINVKTKVVENKHEHPTVWVDSPVFGRMDQTPGYVRGWLPPNYQVPAIRYRDWVEIGYLCALNQFDTDTAFDFIQRYY